MWMVIVAGLILVSGAGLVCVLAICAAAGRAEREIERLRREHR